MFNNPFFRFLGKIMATIIVVFMTITISFVALIVLIGAAVSMGTSGNQDDSPYKYVYGNKDSKNKILVVKISGVILGDEDEDESGFGLSGNNTYGYKVKEDLRKATKENEIKAVILDINSPGGTIFGAKAIADGVKYYKQKTHKPVIAYVSGIAASGAFWSAVSADTIIADVGTETGSIGVISGPFKYYDKVLSEDGGLFNGGVVTQNGIQSFYITAGKSKDLGNPYRKITDDELKVLQGGVNNEYDGFVRYVSERRGIDENTIRNQIGALIYDNKTAKELHLIDKTESKDDAYNELAHKLNLSTSDYQIVKENSKPKGFIPNIFGAFTKQPPITASKIQICNFNNVILAYHGDVGALCRE